MKPLSPFQKRVEKAMTTGLKTSREIADWLQANETRVLVAMCRVESYYVHRRKKLSVDLNRQLRALLRHELPGAPTRFRDAPNQLRIRLKVTMQLPKLSGEGGERFFHELAPKERQVFSATLSGDGRTLDVTVFMDRAKTLTPYLNEPWKGKQQKW